MNDEIVIDGVVYVKKIDSSTGNLNSGDCNSGYLNSGDCNSGYLNSGYKNSGDSNSGNGNSGDCNSGDSNSGNWNSGDWNSGFFNVTTPKNIIVFGKKVKYSVWDETYTPNCLFFNLTNWVNEDQMSNAQKQDNPSYSFTGGFLEVYGYKEAFTRSVTSASKEDRDAIRALPNFDADIFLEISGCDLRLLDLDEE